MILYYLEEFKTTEIAETLNYPIGSVRSRLHAGRKNLELQVNDYQS
ncbi:MAG: sigma factor-like helix-turn-helix DNA-binding protein [Coprobacillaceae bacterium]